MTAIPATVTVGVHRYKLTIDHDGFVTGLGNRGMTHPERCLIAVCGTLLAPRLLDLLRDNPDLVDYLTTD